jgi:hypothetical protein
MVYADTPNYWDYHVRVLTEAVTFKLSNGRIITLEKGFEWDEASIPWLFSWAFPKSGKYAYSALVHDAIYYAKYDSRKFADKEFRYWMQATLNNRLQIAVRYYIVRLFGWMYWDAKLSNRAINNQKLISIT